MQLRREEAEDRDEGRMEEDPEDIASDEDFERELDAYEENQDAEGGPDFDDPVDICALHCPFDRCCLSLSPCFLVLMLPFPMLPFLLSFFYSFLILNYFNFSNVTL